MVLVGRGGLRLREDVSLVGVRWKGRRTMAEEKAEAALDHTLDAESLKPADKRLGTELCELWNAPGAPLRARLLESMETRAARRHELVLEQLTKRQSADIQRAPDKLRGVPGRSARLAGASCALSRKLTRTFILRDRQQYGGSGHDRGCSLSRAGFIPQPPGRR
jgi:hypothetical protein